MGNVGRKNVAIRRVGLLATLFIIAFIGFTGSAYTAYQHEGVLHELLDPAVMSFNDYLNFISGKNIQSTNSMTVEPKSTLPNKNQITNSPERKPNESPMPNKEIILADELNLIQDAISVNDEPLFSVCNTHYKTECVYNMDSWGWYYTDTLESQIFDLINQERKSRNLNILEYDGRPASHASYYSKYLAETNTFEHSDGGKLRTWQDFSGHVYKTCGENLSVRYNVLNERYSLEDIANLTHNGLMNSEGHKANILNKDYTTLGVGVFIDHDGGYMIKLDKNHNTIVTKQWYENAVFTTQILCC